jgi:hypothetical protein
VTGGSEETVILGARWKSALPLLISLAFVALGLSLSHGPAAKHVIVGWLTVLFFGFCFLTGVLQLMRPTRLRMTPQGFTIEMFPWRPRTVSWGDVDEFFLWTRRGAKLVAFSYVPGRAPDGLITRANRAVGAEGALPAGLRVRPERLLELMQAWKDRAR